MNCTKCKFYKPGDCVKNCLQIYFKYDPLDPNRFPVRIHKSEVAYIEGSLDSNFLSITDTDGIQHSYNIDTISHFHIPNFNNK